MTFDLLYAACLQILIPCHAVYYSAYNDFQELCIIKPKTKMFTSVLHKALFVCIGILLLILMHSTESKAQTTIEFFATSDNTIYQEFTDYSNGSGEYLFAGTTVPSNKRRGLIDFNYFTELIPPCATIQSVTLTLHMSRTISGPKTVKLHRLLESWGEGSEDAFGEEGFGTQADTGSATWTDNYYTQSNWSRPGGYFDDSASASASVDQIGFYSWSSARMAADVQSWLRSPGSNFGWIIIGDESTGTTAKRFDTRENQNFENVPKLTVTYVNNNLPLNAGCLIEGRWDGFNMVPDTAKVFLRGSSSPYPYVDSARGVIDAFGNFQVCFENAGTGSYYIVVRHRNSIETWSAAPVALTNLFFNYYGFTSSAGSAYGNNLTLKLGSYCIYSGDVNQDETVDATDLSLIDNDAINFIGGYVVTDLTGDDFVDATDYAIADNNANNFVSVIRP